MASRHIMFPLWLAREGAPPQPPSADLFSQPREPPHGNILLLLRLECLRLRPGWSSPSLLGGGDWLLGAVMNSFAAELGRRTRISQNGAASLSRASIADPPPSYLPVS